MARKDKDSEPPNPGPTEGDAAGDAAAAAADAAGAAEQASASAYAAAAGGPPPHRKKLGFFSGIALFILLSLVMNNPCSAAPLVVWAVIVTVLVIGKAAHGGVKWLLSESPVAFRAEDSVGPLDWLAKLVPWIGFGAAIPAAVVVTAANFVAGRPPHEMLTYLHYILQTLHPTIVLCLALLPLAWIKSGSEPFTERDRGVFPIAAGLLIYCAWALCSHVPGPHGVFGFVFGFVRAVWDALQPIHWPHHILSTAAACGVLHLWFACAGDKAVCGKQGDA
jgi:hypothetical protein